VALLYFLVIVRDSGSLFVEYRYLVNCDIVLLYSTVHVLALVSCILYTRFLLDNWTQSYTFLSTLYFIHYYTEVHMCRVSEKPVEILCALYTVSCFQILGGYTKVIACLLCKGTW
jgi:hypothetical protein